MHRVIPRPVSVQPAGGVFTFSEATTIVVPAGDADAERVGRYLSALIGAGPGQTPPRVEPAATAAPGQVQLLLTSLADAGSEGYELSISPERITIAANRPAGLSRRADAPAAVAAGVEYEAAVPDKARPFTVAAGRVVDRPRFEWRGAMLDVARHFFPLEEVKRYIDLLTLYKINRLHLHLSDDQGWRIEIGLWPNLTRHGGSTSVGGGPGGYYTQRDYAELVKYANDRFVTVVPEIDMPGHTNAALSSYPELNCDGIAPPAVHRHSGGLQRLVRGERRHLSVHRRCRARDCRAVRPVLPHWRRRGFEARTGQVQGIRRAGADDRAESTAK